MRYRVLDENGDFTIGNEHAYIEGADAVRQARPPPEEQCRAPEWNNENRTLTIRAAIQSTYGAFIIDEEV